MKIDTAQRLLMCNTLSSMLPLYIVTEYPKSGGSWVSQMIADYLNLPYPRNQRPKLQSCVMHGHMLPTPFMKNVFCVFRDGRDVMVSSYFHRLFQNDRNPPIMVERTRKALNFEDYDNVRENMPRFIQYTFESRKKSINPNQFTWSHFVNAWIDKDVCKIKYEDMLAEGRATLARALEEVTGKEIDKERVDIIIKKYSFENQAKRERGKEDKTSFLRKGVSGDWREKFSNEAARMFNIYAGCELIKLGYEPDSSWVNNI